MEKTDSALDRLMAAATDADHSIKGTKRITAYEHVAVNAFPGLVAALREKIDDCPKCDRNGKAVNWGYLLYQPGATGEEQLCACPYCESDRATLARLEAEAKKALGEKEER